MKRFLITILIACSLAMAASAEQQANSVPTLRQELGTALQDLSAAQVGTLTVGDLQKLFDRLSIAEQKIRYVQRARVASMFIPGAGQYMTGDAVGGTLFLLADVAVAAGTLVGAYYLLPANVQFASLDYFTGPVGNIKTAWESNSLVSYLPSAGVMVGGMILKGILGKFSSANAASLARRNIAEGKVTFEPSLGFMGHGFGMGMGFGMGLRMRF